ncbi:glycoside hydrolase family 32 protein [Pseudarthrobacter sp. J75]|uniref:glycoside hydrolase family 32 protein n=1 Tax=unclassified Pseudarthrobacter TaxID=2647000 RepID=UPI002E812BFC|nr:MULTISPECIES: glycoside hydrolase family 32 protein [unclassified Pseudarthrobacter]MEE2524164.1 glycoside hydrolase family 32 protein [Pseudarthrobacter sp. J47]MEE2530202.1 glycoside hydrolase family 32 protein [Pseudarthrobacter sp. J75]MEE2568927.1 glycoside hydrolase family 32 protein [Pseudarthrobacter sp. J64]
MSSRLDAARPETAPGSTSRFRPAVHFTARDTWLNDPNGLIFHDGVYHLFFQNNPYGNVWGNMSWGHATSRDLLHWTEHPVAIAGDDVEDIYSGSVVLDHGNTSGLGTADQPALVAIYTSAFKAASPYSGIQAQSLAYSTNAGMTWTKYQGNPVLTRDSANFRDPKVFRYEGEQGACWIMVAVEALEQKVVFYRSEDLKSWEFLSHFGPANSDAGEWECPDLFPLAVDGDPANIKWVLIVNVNPGAVAGGSGGQYFIGEFDGGRFVPDAGSVVAPTGLSALPDPGLDSSAADAVGDNAVLRQCLWLDWGRDCYASVSFSNVPDGRRIIMGWMNNWDYANELPTDPWRSSMTLAREVRLTAVDGTVRLVQQPVLGEPTAPGKAPAAEQLKTGPVELRDSALRLPDAVPGSAQVIEAQILPGSAGRVDFRLFSSSNGKDGTRVGYDVGTAQLFLDRRKSGNTGFHGKFASVESAPVALEDGVLRLLIVVDHCSVEVFAQDGKVVMTDLVFPDAENQENWLTVEGGQATILKLAVSRLNQYERSQNASNAAPRR